MKRKNNADDARVCDGKGKKDTNNGKVWPVEQYPGKLNCKHPIFDVYKTIQIRSFFVKSYLKKNSITYYHLMYIIH